MTDQSILRMHGAAQVPSRADSLRHYFEGRLIRAKMRRESANYVCDRDDAIQQIQHYGKLIATLEGRA